MHCDDCNINIMHLISGVHVEGIHGAGWEVHRPRSLVHRSPVQLLQVSLDGEFVKPNLNCMRRLFFRILHMSDASSVDLLRSDDLNTIKQYHYLILEVLVFGDVEVGVDAVELARVEDEVGIAEELARAPHLLSDGGAGVTVQPVQVVQTLLKSRLNLRNGMTSKVLRLGNIHI